MWRRVWLVSTAVLLGVGGAGPASAQAPVSLPDFTDWAEIIPTEHPTRGATHYDGEVRYDAAKDEYYLAGNGWDIQETGDECFFVYRKIKGSFRIEATVEWVYAEHEWAKAGLMVRESTSGHSAQTNIITSGHPNSPDRWEVGTRLSYGAGYSPTSWANLPQSMYGQPTRLRLTRIASTNEFIREWFNTETNSWVGISVTIPNMPEEVLVGLAVTSHIDGESWAEALFRDVEIVQLPFTVWRSVSTTNIPPGGSVEVQLTVNVEAETPPNFTITERYPQGWSVSNLNASVGQATDDGSGTITWQATGVTGQPTLSYTLTVPATAAGTGTISGTWDNGAGVTGEIASVTILVFEMPATDLGIFDRNMDIGSPGAAGSVGRSGNDWVVIGSGHDIWDQADDFHFLYMRVQGDFTMTVEDASIVPFGDTPTSSAWAKVGIMARQSLTAPSPYAFAMLRSSDQAFCLQWREDEGGSAAWDGDASQTYVPDHHGAFGLRREGNDFTAFYIDSTGAEVVNNVHYVEMTDPIWVGIAVTSHETGATAAGFFSNVKFTGTALPFPFRVQRSVSTTTAPPGTTVDVELKVTIREGAPGNFTIVENYPAGWPVSNLTATFGQAQDDGAGKITWTASGASGVGTLTYTLTVPPDASGLALVSGTYDDGAGEVGDTGSAQIMTFVFPATDLGIFDGHMDIGAVGAEGTVGRVGDDWAVVGSGADIWGTADAFHYLYKRVQGDFRMSIDNASIQPFGANPTANDWAKMGIMARQSLTPESAYAFAMLRMSDQAFLIQYREAEGASAAPGFTGGSAVYVEDIGAGGCCHSGGLILERRGNDFWILYKDSVTGQEIEWDVWTVVMEDPIYVGIAVTSHSTGQTGVGFFSNPQFTGTAVDVRQWMLH